MNKQLEMGLVKTKQYIKNIGSEFKQTWIQIFN